MLSTPIMISTLSFGKTYENDIPRNHTAFDYRLGILIKFDPGYLY